MTRSGGSSKRGRDPAGRLTRETRGDRSRTFAYDAAGQLLTVTDADGQSTSYGYDGAGRRIRTTTSTSVTCYDWDDRGWLSGITEQSTSDAARVTAPTELWVNALGELAEADAVPITWDIAACAPAPLSIGDTSTFHGPGSFTGIDGEWTVGGWRDTRTGVADDPWQALAAVGGMPDGLSLTAGGALLVDGLEWMGARAYDPATRGFLSVDPLNAPAGAAWSANLYSFAGNDPLHAVDPLGLQPVTDAELTAYANANQGALATTATAVGHWWDKNWEYVAGGAMIVAGGVMMATGVGGPIGLALIGAGADTIIQKATTGEVNWGQVALSGAFGLIPGAGIAGNLLAHVGANAAEGAVQNVAQYAISGQPLTPGGFLQNAAAGAAMSAVSAGALKKLPVASAVKKLDEEAATPRVPSVDDHLPGLPSTARPLEGLGSTGRTEPRSLHEQLAMTQARSNLDEGSALSNLGMGDERWSADDGWQKMRNNVNGVEIHYVQNSGNGAIDDFKFK